MNPPRRPRLKRWRSACYNYDFDRVTGMFARWGRTLDDDPPLAPAPEIADIELSTGDCSGRCAFCYKGNAPASGRHMRLDTFQALLARFPTTLTQIAFGLTDADANPDLVPILHHCRTQGVVPNLTLSGHGLDEHLTRELAGLCGAVAVSVYPHTRELAYQTIEGLSVSGLVQTNVHLLVHRDNAGFVDSVLDDLQTDPRLRGLHALILLSLKPRGRAAHGFAPIPEERFHELCGCWCSRHARIGFDSCLAPSFERYLDARDLPPDHDSRLRQMVERCEAGLFSLYVNVDAEAFPCSFLEGTPGWERGIDVLAEDSLVPHVWSAERMEAWRRRLFAVRRECPVYAPVDDAAGTDGGVQRKGERCRLSSLSDKPRAQ